MQSFGKKLAIFGHFSAKTDFFFVLAALQPPMCCSNTTANTFQWVRPQPWRSSMLLQNVRAFKSKQPPTVMKTKDNRNKPHHSEHPSIWFSQSVQHRTKCIMNTELRHLHFQRYDPDAFPWGAWPREAAVDTHKQAGRQSTALTGASSRSCHVTKRFRILATLKQGNKSMYSNTSGYVHMGLRLDWGKGITGQ